MYDVARGTKRWPVSVFFSMLNIAAINAYVIYRRNTNVKITRQDFLKKLAYSLMERYVERRLHTQQTPVDVKNRIKDIFPNLSEQEEDEETESDEKC